MSKIKVLIVDDEKEFATTLAQRLDIRGFKATAVFCCEDALAQIHAKKIPDVVLLDLKMPQMDGMEALREIKKYDNDIEVIMLTGHMAGIPLTGIDKEKNSAFDCVMKPPDINDLTDLIKQAVAKKQNDK